MQEVQVEGGKERNESLGRRRTLVLSQEGCPIQKLGVINMYFLLLSSLSLCVSNLVDFFFCLSADVSQSTPSPGRSSSLHYIAEEESLPFPEVGLPPTPPSRGSQPHTPHSSEPTSLTASPYPSVPSSPPRHSQPLADLTLLGKNASALFLKVKTLTTQLAEKVETQQTQKQVKNVVKDIFSSLSSSQPLSGAGSHDISMTSSQQVFQNSNFALPISPPSEPEMGEFAMVGSPLKASSDQSDGRISAPLSPPPLMSMLEEEISFNPKLTEFSKATMEAM